MSKVLHIEDIIHPTIGPAISLKPLIDSYILRYNQFAAKEIKIYCIKGKKDNYIVHVMVPSEKNDEFEKPVFYDVVIEFYPENKDQKESASIADYGVKLFSNSVSWMFNFTYVFAKSNNIPSFIPKGFYSKAALREPPKKTNPYGIYGIERVVFIAFYHLELITGYRKNRLSLIESSKIKNESDIVKLLMSQEEKLEQLNIEEKRLRLKNQKDKLKNKMGPKINIINEKTKRSDNLSASLDKKFDADVKHTFETNLKNKDLRANMVANIGKIKKTKKK